MRWEREGRRANSLTQILCEGGSDTGEHPVTHWIFPPGATIGSAFHTGPVVRENTLQSASGKQGRTAYRSKWRFDF